MKKLIYFFKNLLGIIEVKNELIQLKLDYQNLIEKTERLNANVDVLKSVIFVGLDYNPPKYGNSWAVISLKGNKKEFVNFYNLKDKDIMEISKFLSNFDKDHITIDAPMGIKF